MLRYADVKRAHCRELIEFQYGTFIDAWKRQLADMPCPLRLENGKLFRRMSQKCNSCPPRPRTPADPGFDWEEATDVQPEAHWRAVEIDAFRVFAKEHGITTLATLPHTSAVVFLGVVDGRHCCRPATEA